jgi:hypothetical protein
MPTSSSGSWPVHSASLPYAAYTVLSSYTSTAFLERTAHVLVMAGQFVQCNTARHIHCIHPGPGGMVWTQMQAVNDFSVLTPARALLRCCSGQESRHTAVLQVRIMLLVVLSSQPDFGGYIDSSH